VKKGIPLVTILQESDQAVEHIAAALEVYEQTHPAAACFVYRYNPAAIRVKIIDPPSTDGPKVSAMITPGGFFVVYPRMS
jgi:hypothetical protein